MIFFVTITIYSAYIQIHDPGIGFLDYSILSVELVILLLFILRTFGRKPSVRFYTYDIMFEYLVID